MLRRRGPFGVLVLVGLGILLGAALFGGMGAIGSVLAAPLLVLGFLFKIVLFFILFGLVARLFAGAGARSRSWPGRSRERWSDWPHARWQSRSEARDGDEDPRAEDRFEEWHRMAHARQEVDDHTPPFEE